MDALGRPLLRLRGGHLRPVLPRRAAAARPRRGHRGGAHALAGPPAGARVHLALREQPHRPHPAELRRARPHAPQAQPQPERALRRDPAVPRRLPLAPPARPLLQRLLRRDPCRDVRPLPPPPVRLARAQRPHRPGSARHCQLLAPRRLRLLLQPPLRRAPGPSLRAAGDELHLRPEQLHVRRYSWQAHHLWQH
uniref:Uncharacterized protein n=1 Tax=Arundo donax TaxID=35708 RepID=A0A0A9GCP3_ARUDO